ncbi:hypothetical protein PYCCODRAFT_1426158 [Trametes coccinea BRFM310]|uniref:Uncharacterized protein n=1 Tax=Trametes coccinea (strain BRFM310) TaxID=1353009 RepID=A0A1Y2III6_TRAC3|nr:hypothetical protein PYCCODRAFT_1426158 [Trametes coccinea BRFM310]
MPQHVLQVGQNTVKVRREYLFAGTETPRSPTSPPDPDFNSPSTRLMHNRDVIEHIISQMAQPAYTSLDRRQLMSIMLTNKAFFHDAATLLWSTFLGNQGLEPVLKILGEVGIQSYLSGLSEGMSDSEIASRHAKFAEDVTTSIAWNHTLYYASLVKTAIISGVHMPQAGWLSIISSIMPDHSPLFCSLRTLYWAEGFLPSSALLYLLPTTLEILSISIAADLDDDPIKGKPFMKWLATFSEKLSLLTPNLASLSILCQGCLPDWSYQTYFSSLHDVPIAIVGTDASISTASPRPIMSLQQFYLSSSHSSSAVFHVSAWLASNLAPRLSYLQIKSIMVVPKGKGEELLSLLAPILTLDRLKTLDILLNGHELNFDTNALFAIAKAFPALEAVNIHIDADWDYNSGIYPPDLEAVGRYLLLCPALKRILLPVIAGPRSPQSLGIPRQHNRALQTVQFHKICAPLGEHLRAHELILAALLDAFPSSDQSGNFLQRSSWVLENGRFVPYLFHIEASPVFF